MQEAFEQLIATSQGRIRYIANRYSGANDLEDIYQEILIQLWRSFPSFEGKSALETWVYKVALNTACSYVRISAKHKQSSNETLQTQAVRADENACQADILEAFMDTLKDIDANILMMYLDGLSSEQSADVLGTSSSAVRSRIKRIKQQFEQQYIEEKS